MFDNPLFFRKVVEIKPLALRAALLVLGVPSLAWLDCLQSAFSLKILLVLISSSAIANPDLVITIRDTLISRGSRRKVARLNFFRGIPPNVEH